MSFKQLIIEDIRLCILRLLAEDQGYSHNTSILQTALGRLGHTVTRDQVETNVAWLNDQGYLTTNIPTEGVTVAKITQAGLDVAAGRTTVPGVKRPGPQG